MEKHKARKLVITLESFLPSAIETQASLLPIPPNSKSQVICLPLIPSAISHPGPAEDRNIPSDVAHINELEDLPESAINYILSLREQWLTRVEACINTFLEDSDLQTQHPWQRVGERVVFMLGGITGVKFACVKKIAEDATGGDMVIAMEIFQRILRGWSKKGAKVGSSTPNSSRPINHHHRRDISTPSGSQGDTPISRGVSPNSAVSRFSIPGYRVPIHSQDTLIDDDAYEDSTTPSRTGSYATAYSSPPDDGPHILISKAYALEFDQDSEPNTPVPSLKLSPKPLESAKSKLKRPSSLIILPSNSSSLENDSSSAHAVLHNRPSLNEIRRNASTPLGTSWYGSRDSKMEESTLEALLERSLSIKRATSYDRSAENAGATVITGDVMDIEEFGGRLPDVNKHHDRTSQYYGSEKSFLQLAEDDTQSPLESHSDNELESCPTLIGLPKVDIRSSWLAPPTAGGELEEILRLSEQTRDDDSEFVTKPSEAEELFPSLFSRLKQSIDDRIIEREWCEGVLYLDADTPRVCSDRVVYDSLLEESLEDDSLKSFQSHYRLPSPSPDVRFPTTLSPQGWAWRAPTGFESTPLVSSQANVRKVKLAGKKRKNGIEIQNELRSFVRELTQAISSYELDHDNESDYGENNAEPGPGDLEPEEGEQTLTLWRDMFSTHGQWPLSTVNLIVALGREGPTNTVKGGSGRVMAEAMARRLEGWDLRCRRISLRYLLYLARRNGHLGTVTMRPPPRQLIAELEFFLSLHEPTDLLILEFNTNSREETEAVLELSALLGRGTRRPSADREPSTMLRMACVISGGVPRDLDVRGIVVGNTPEFAASSTRPETTFEGFRFPTCRSPGQDKQKQRPITAWARSLVAVADLVVEDSDTENESRQQRYLGISLETQLEHAFGVLDHWTAVARLRPTSEFPVSESSSPMPTSPNQTPSRTPRRGHSRSGSRQVITPPAKPSRKRSRGASRTLLEVIVTAFTEVDGEDTDDTQEYRQLTTCREVFCQSPSSGGTFLEDAADEDSSSDEEDDYDLGINGFQPSIGIIEAHEQTDSDGEEEEEEEEEEEDDGPPEDASMVEDYDMVVAMQYSSRLAPRAVSRKQSKSRKKRTQIWFRGKKRTEVTCGSTGVPALKKMKIMRMSGGYGPGGRVLHGSTRSKDAKGQLGLVLVSNKAMKLLGLERGSGAPVLVPSGSP